MVVGGNRKGRTIKQNSCVHVPESSHLLKVCRKPCESSHLLKVENGEDVRKRHYTRCGCAVAQSHLLKVCRKPRESSHLRKVGQRERWPAQCALRNVSSAVKYSSVWVNAAWRCLQSNSRRVTSGEAVRGLSRRRGLTVSSVAWISSMGTEMS